MNVPQRIFNINSNILTKLQRIYCFVLVASVSVIYKDKTSIKQISTQSMYVPLFRPILYKLTTELNGISPNWIYGKSVSK